MEATKIQLQKAQEFFKNNSLRKKVFATSDNFLFIQEQDAKAHAKTLENIDIVPITLENESDEDLEINLQ